MKYPWLKKQWPAISRIAIGYSFDPLLIAAFVAQESGGVPQRCRFEPAWKFYNAPEKFAKSLGISYETEKEQQMFSYGLMQVMGATARDMGYIGYLNDLCIPDIGLSVGCKFLAEKAKKYPAAGDLISSYNMGTPRKDAQGRYVNQKYVDDLLKHMQALQGEDHG